jgi:hypothetical protein
MIVAGVTEFSLYRLSVADSFIDNRRRYGPRLGFYSTVYKYRKTLGVLLPGKSMPTVSRTGTYTLRRPRSLEDVQV